MIHVEGQNTLLTDKNEHIKMQVVAARNCCVHFTLVKNHHLASCLEPVDPNVNKALEPGVQAATVTAEYWGLKDSIKQSPQTYP